VAGVAQLVRALDCGSRGRRFDPGHSPHFFLVMQFDLKAYRSTKIVATISHKSNIKAFFECGVDVLRINSSHGDHDQYRKMIESIRYFESAFKKPMPILFDLQGPKLRIGEVSPDTILRVNDLFALDLSQEPGSHRRVFFSHFELYEILSPGCILLLDDGKIKLEVISCTENKIETHVIVGGVLSSFKGVNVPSLFLPIKPLTPKDQKDLSFALENQVDFVGLSFVQSKNDVLDVQKIIGERAQLVAKIEKPAAIQNLDEIIDVSDAIMVARGDLGAELPLEDIPFLQKKIVKHARAKGKPVIVATQMLESMICNSSPTRAEVCDVAQAVIDGVDAVALSAESATGAFPLESIQMMDRIIRAQEKHNIAYEDQVSQCLIDKVALSLKQLAKNLDAKYIATLSQDGLEALHIARQRPSAIGIILSSSLQKVRQMSLVWGAQCFLVKNIKNKTDDIVGFIEENTTLKGSMIIVSCIKQPYGDCGLEFQINYLHLPLSNSLPLNLQSL
jgi:pyruvate kinase